MVRTGERSETREAGDSTEEQNGDSGEQLASIASLGVDSRESDIGDSGKPAGKSGTPVEKPSRCDEVHDCNVVLGRLERLADSMVESTKCCGSGSFNACGGLECGCDGQITTALAHLLVVIAVVVRVEVVVVVVVSELVVAVVVVLLVKVAECIYLCCYWRCWCCS